MNNKNEPIHPQPNLVKDCGLLGNKVKRGKNIDLDSSRISFPSSALKNREISILEAIVVYLKEKKKFSYHEIAVLLNRDDRTIWTCYNRAIKKRVIE